MSNGFRERLSQKPDTREMQRGPSKASGLQRLLVVLEGEPFAEILAPPSLGAGQPAGVSQVVAHLPDEFHLLIQEMVLPKSQRQGSVPGEPGACRSRRAWFRFSKAKVACMVS